ncbi:hypothetical protein [Chitinophaga alhagiae]|uniref:hypothetical protein n=1 Tax=Chitinophaga alhagiae TaxID=2203219 RepID=UPI0013007DB5|nr:hypothetical protein [Chitinophaga alhagiae]
MVLTATIAFSQTHSLSFNDTRSVNYPPDSFRFETRFDFKYRSIIGVPGDGTYSGLMTVAPWSDASGGNVHQVNFNNEGLFYRQGAQGGSWQEWSKLLTSRGAQAMNGPLQIRTDHDAPITLYNTEANSWQYIQFMGPDNARSAYMGLSASNHFHLVTERGGNIVFKGGNVGIGTETPGTCKLAVEGTIGARKVKVTQQVWADHVFADTYSLPTLYELEAFVKAHKHLPEVPTEREVIANGVDLGEMNKTLLQKVEELTLYLIEHRKELDALKADNKRMLEELSKLKK